ncbi:MAG: long-chain acyl-CoA synthetase [Verrucomicrobiales bacterium]|jgi:long-chain acyl-CoA synthetase
MLCETMLLYDRWRKTADHGADRWALCEGAQVWTFRQLQTALDALPTAQSPVVLQGRSALFILHTLQAWRDGQIAVPIEEGASAPVQLDTVAAEIVHVKTTSGSTGTPRLVLFTAEQLAADAAQIVQTMGLRPEWPNLGVISLAHSYGFSSLVLPLLLHGIPLSLAPNPLPETMRGLLAKGSSGDGVTIPAVPAMWRTWHAAGVLDARKVRLAISAGAPLPLEVERTIFDSCELKVHNFLGASECGGIAYDATNHPRQQGSTWIGSGLNGVTLAVAESGVLQVRSAAVGIGYWPEAEADASLFNGTFQTTDLVRLESGQNVHLLGRASDVINVAGRKIHPDEIESLLNSQAEVTHAVVFGIPCQQSLRGEDMVAVLKLQDGAQLAVIKRALASALEDSEWKMPRRWQVEPALRPDSRGKISRSVWKERFLARN